MTQNIGRKLFALISRAESIAITTHINSDGDGMVAAIALQELLRLKGFDSLIITDGEDLSRYAFLMQHSSVQAYQPGMQHDLVIVLDCNSHDRLGERNALVQSAQITIVIDHHVVEHAPIEGELKLIETHFVSTGAMLFHYLFDEIKQLPPEARKFIADCAYVTILNDTNNFSNANTTADVFEICRDLVKEGSKPHLLNMAYLQNHSATEMMYVGRSLATIRLVEDEKILFLHSDLQLAQSLDFDPGSTMSVTRYVQGVAGLRAIAYFREVEPDIWKVSLRSLILDVQKIAAIHGGGGHRKASGLTLMGKLPDVQDLIQRELAQALKAQ